MAVALEEFRAAGSQREACSRTLPHPINDGEYVSLKGNRRMSDPVWALPGSVESSGIDGPYLVGGQCGACALKLYPQAPVCPACWSKDVAPARLSRRGTLYTYTVVYAGRSGWQTPYALGYVDLDDGVRVCAPLDFADGEAPKIGGVVELTAGPLRTDEKGVTHLSHRFRQVAQGVIS